MSAPLTGAKPSAGLRFDFTRLRRDVEELAAMERGSAARDKPQVAWLEQRLRHAGAHEIRTEAFRFQRHWIWRYGAHGAAGIGAAAVGGPVGAAVAAGVLTSIELDVSGRSTWLARFLPAGEGANVVARVPAAGHAQRMLVLIAHHDTQRTGLMWRLPRTKLPVVLPEAVLAAIAAGCLLGSRVARGLGALALGAATLLGLDAARGRLVPGANDNASGVAALVALLAALARDPLERTDVVAVFSDCEESGFGGTAGWLREHRAELDDASTLVVAIDTLGSGDPAVVSRDGTLTARYSRDAQAWADRGALRAGVAPPRRIDLVAPTDGSPPNHARLRTISLTSCATDGTLGPHYHLPSDTPENVDWESVAACTRLAGGIARVFDAVS